MRIRPILFAVAVGAAVGLVALSTVMAQQPSGSYTQPKTSSATPTVRPYNDWTPPPPPGYKSTQTGNGTKPIGGSYLPAAGSNVQQIAYPPPGGTPSNRPRISSPGVATGDIKPASAIDTPQPGAEVPAADAKMPLKPPSVSLDANDNKLPAAPINTQPGGTVPPPSGVIPPPPSGAIPPPPSGTVPPPPSGTTPPSSGTVPPTPLPSTPVVPPGPSAPATPKPFPALPSIPSTPPSIGTTPLPGRVSQSITIEAVCPDSVTYNAEFSYDIVVRNTGNVPVQNVRIEDEVPSSARYIGSDPPAEVSGDKLIWAVGTMEASTDKRITVRLRSSEEGELRSRASVTYAASVEAKTRITRPRLAVAATCVESCRVGEDAIFQIKITNSGSGPAENMVLRAEMTDGLFFTAAPKVGPKLETTLAKLPAGETKTLNLSLSAVKAGMQTCQFTVMADGSSETVAKAQVNAVEARLEIVQKGPAKCLVRGEPVYEITLTNPGTAPTEPITLHAVLPDGFDYVQSSDAGTYSTVSRAISWRLAALPPNGAKTVALKMRAAVAGDVVLRAVAVSAPETEITPASGTTRVANRMLEAKGEAVIKAEGVPAIRFEVKDLDDPVEAGKEAVYEIRVTNQGTGACTNVQLMAALADGTTFVKGTGPMKAQGQTLVFDTIKTLPVKGETVYTVRVKGNVTGDLRFRVQLTCDQVRTPIVKEESTSFYKQ